MPERVLLETARYRVKGTVMLPPEGYRTRLSDLLNESGRDFLVILDATLTPFDDPVGTFETDVLMVQKTKVDVVFPMGERKT